METSDLKKLIEKAEASNLDPRPGLQTSELILVVLVAGSMMASDVLGHALSLETSMTVGMMVVSFVVSRWGAKASSMKAKALSAIGKPSA